MRVGGLVPKKSSKTTPKPDPEEGLKDFENAENRLTLNFIKKSSSNANIPRPSHLYQKIQTEAFDPKITPTLKRSFHSKTNSEVFNEKLFERFLVIGLTKKDLLSAMEGSGDNNMDPQNFKPKILYNYPKDSNEEVIQDFAFPFGVPAEKITGNNSFTRINE